MKGSHAFGVVIVGNAEGGSVPVPSALILDAGVSWEAKRAYLTLAAFADDANVSMDTIALHMPIPAFNRGMGELIKEGWTERAEGIVFLNAARDEDAKKMWEARQALANKPGVIVRKPPKVKGTDEHDAAFYREEKEKKLQALIDGEDIDPAKNPPGAFCQEFARAFGYMPELGNYGHAGSELRRLVNAHGAQEYRQALANYFADKWREGRVGYTWRGFVNAFDRYRPKTHTRNAKPVDDYLRRLEGMAEEDGNS